MPDPVIIDGELVPPSGNPTHHAQVELRAARLPRRYDIRDSPLWDWSGSHSLSGVIVTDPVLIAQIAARVAKYSRRGWWFRSG